MLDSAINETKNTNALTDDMGAPTEGIGNGQTNHTGHHGNEAPQLQDEGGQIQGGGQNQTGAVLGNSTGSTGG